MSTRRITGKQEAITSGPETGYSIKEVFEEFKDDFKDFKVEMFAFRKDTQKDMKALSKMTWQSNGKIVAWGAIIAVLSSGMVGYILKGMP